MIFKSFIFACTALLLSSRGAKCGNDARWRSAGKSNSLVLPEAESFTERKNDINQIEPSVKKAVAFGKERQKNHTKSGRNKFIKSSLNVNVNPGDYQNRPWYNPLQNRYGSLRGLSRRKTRQLMQLLDILPYSNVDYNLMHPDGNLYAFKRKHPTRKAENTLEGVGIDVMSIEDGKTGCYSAVVDALEYLQSVEMNLRNVDLKLKSLLRRLSNTDSYGNVV